MADPLSQMQTLIATQACWDEQDCVKHLLKTCSLSKELRATASQDAADQHLQDYIAVIKALAPRLVARIICNDLLPKKPSPTTVLQPVAMRLC